MKPKTILKFTAITLATLLLILLAIFFFWLGPTVKAVAENLGSKALGVPVQLESLTINPRKGLLNLSQFSVANHDHFSRSNAVSISTMNMDIDIGSLFSSTIMVHNVQIDSPHFIYEQGNASDNINEFIISIQNFAGIDPHAAPKAEKKKEKQDKSQNPKIVIVEHLEINDIQLHLANTTDPQLDIDLGIQQLSLSMTNGMARLSQLTLSNPSRLTIPNLFTLEGVVIKLIPSSIYSPTPEIIDAQITKPHAYLERNAETSTIAELLKIVESFADQVATAPNANPAAPPTTPKEKSNTAPLKLHNLQIADIQLYLLDTTNTNAPTQPQTFSSIGSISIKLVDGQIAVNEITLPNLPGEFTTTNLFHLANLNMGLAPDSIFSDQVVINEVRIENPTLNLERTKNTGNITELLKLAEALAPPAAETKPAPQAPPTSAPVPLAEMPAILHQLIVTNLAVNMISPVETNSLKNAFPMPSISQLNPMGMLKENIDTNAIEHIEVDGQLTLVAFDQLTLEPLNGLLHLKQLQVGNPEGFANKNIVMLDEFKLSIAPDTLQSDVMQIREILIDNPTIAYERKLLIDNIKALQIFIKEATEPANQKAAEEKPQTTEEDSEKQKVVIEHLLVKSGLVKAKLSALPSAPIPLPKIEMHDIGKEKGGTTPVQAATEIGEEFYDKIIGAVSSTTGFASDALKGIGALSLPVAENQTDTPPPEETTTQETQPPQEPTLETKPKRKPRVRFPGRRF